MVQDGALQPQVVLDSLCSSVTSFVTIRRRIPRKIEFYEDRKNSQGMNASKPLQPCRLDCPLAMSEHTLANHNNAWRWNQALL